MGKCFCKKMKDLDHKVGFKNSNSTVICNIAINQTLMMPYLPSAVAT